MIYTCFYVNFFMGMFLCNFISRSLYFKKQKQKLMASLLHRQNKQKLALLLCAQKLNIILQRDVILYSVN